jgi:O-antigen/teichoic acid export membrane protein
MPDAAAPSSGVGALRRRGLAEGFWAFVGQVGSGLMLLVGTRLITELVSPAVFGQVALLSGLVGLGVTLFAYPLISAGIRLAPEYPSDNRKRLFLGGLKQLINRSTWLALLLLSVAGGWMAYLYQVDPQALAAAALLLVVTIRRELGVQLLIGQRRQRDASLWQTVDGLLRPVLAIGLVWWGGPESFLILLGYCLAGWLANTVGARFHGDVAGRCHRWTETRSERADILRYALPLIPMEMLSWFTSLGDRYVIGYFMTAQDVGLYAAAYTLTNEAFHRAAIVLLRSFQPVYFAHHVHGRVREASRTYTGWVACVLILGICGVTALVLLKDWVASLLLAQVYRGAADLMPIIGLGCALQAMGAVMAQPLYAAKTTRRLLLGRVIGATSAAISLPLMVQSNGLLGAAAAAPIYFGAEALTLALIAHPQFIRR